MQKEKQNNKFTEAIEKSINKINEVIDTNMIIGTPINLSSNEIIIPISKITTFCLSGGGEYGKTNFFKRNDELPYTLGNGSIVNVKPCGFIVKDNNSTFRYISTEQTSYEKILQKINDVIKELNEN